MLNGKRYHCGLACMLVALLLMPHERAAAEDKTVAAAGLVEPNGEERVVIADATGTLKKVYINEGDVVKKDQLLAEVDNSEQSALVNQAKAVVTLREAELNKLKAGARTEERAAAKAALARSEADLAWRTLELNRRQTLRDQNAVISQQELDSVQAQYESSLANRDLARAQLDQITNGSRKEDIAIAEAALAQAKADLQRAQALFNKTQIRSPIDGVVLKRELREGELVTTLNPLPLARLGDLSQLYVRAEVDELDITRIALGQTATITADALGGQAFSGQVVKLSNRMGRTQARSDNPAEKQDTRVREALIALDGQPSLPIGLRVDVKIQGVNAPAATVSAR